MRPSFFIGLLFAFTSVHLALAERTGPISPPSSLESGQHGASETVALFTDDPAVVLKTLQAHPGQITWIYPDSMDGSKLPSSDPSIDPFGAFRDRLAVEPASWTGAIRARRGGGFKFYDEHSRLTSEFDLVVASRPEEIAPLIARGTARSAPKSHPRRESRESRSPRR